MRSIALATATLLAIAGGGAPPAVADWLVTHDGARVETRGAWEVRGPLVVFTRPDGALVSLRVAEVDLDASARVSAAEDERRRAPRVDRTPGEGDVEADIEPTLVLTDADVRRAAPPAAEAPAPAGEDGGSRATPATRLAVERWQETLPPGGDGLEIAGTVVNRGTAAAGAASVTVVLLGRSGEAIATARATPYPATLMPGADGSFGVSFPGIFDYADIRFDLDGLALTVGTPGTGTSAEREDEATRGEPAEEPDNDSE